MLRVKLNHVRDFSAIPEQWGGRPPSSPPQKKKRAIEKITEDIDQAEQQLEALHGQTSEATFFENPQEQQAEVYAEIKSLESKLSDLMKKWEELELKEE